MTEIYDTETGEFIGDMPVGWVGEGTEQYLEDLGVQPRKPRKKVKQEDRVFMAS